jgi:hypothetical protein
MIHVKILLTNKKDNKKSQPKKLLKRPSQSGHVKNDLSKMAPLSSQRRAISSIFWPIFLIKKTLFSCSGVWIVGIQIRRMQGLQYANNV